MSGFTSVEKNEKAIVAIKPAFKAGGTLLKKKAKVTEPKAEANPWDNLDDKQTQMLNEDELMNEADKAGSVT